MVVLTGEEIRALTISQKSHYVRAENKSHEQADYLVKILLWTQTKL